MKIKKLIVTTGVCLSINTIGLAQKIAHLSLDSLVSQMPETKTAKEIAQNYLKDLEKTMTSMEQELQAKYNDYLANEATMSDLVKRTKQEELQTLQKRIEDFRTQAQQDYQARYQLLINPILDKAKKAIEMVAKENGYKYVLDASAGFILYSEPSDDILPQVKKKLDSMPIANLPGANNNTNTNQDNKGNSKPSQTPTNNKPSNKGK
ncbi:MAG: OmpH family outer membrane protein [Bacteroidetes bacterium]|nr:MAG: OmpH family outer membrane protein [Bacteroidota bacterium]